MRVIWAMDAFEDNKELNRKMAEALTVLYEKSHAEVQPVYLLRENEVLLPTYEVPAWITDHSKTAESLFSEILEDYHLHFLSKPHVIPHASTSHAGTAEVLCNYAEKSKADLIVVGSHSRQGFRRFLLGSFAESLLLQSKIPVYLMGTQCSRTHSLRQILFPTQFGEHSQQSFRHALYLAKKLSAKIILFHAIPRPLEGLFNLNSEPQVFNFKGRSLTIQQILEQQIEITTRRAHIWKNWAHRSGVEASFRIDSSFIPIDQIILEAISRENIDLVIMEAQSGPLSAAILGSCTRNVARAAICPVYVIPRHFYELHKEAPEITRSP